MFSPVAKDSAALRSVVFLGLLTLLCLLPFSGKAFNIDDPLFIWAGHQITAHPWNPFGVKIIWSNTWQPMFEVTKNPPLASYYIAAFASIAGWSERALHLAFILPALGVVLGTYQLARRLTTYPLVAATATLLTPGFLVSATSVMCDTLMLFFWVLAAYFWIKGIEERKRLALFASALLITACALTKYFGVVLVPLLACYTLVRQRRFGTWVWYLLIPTVFLIGYQLWTRKLYGWGLLSSAYYYT
jgi:4-amino-4-deoxy-L-arabinose transferase-like glycosyltransferase